MRAFVAAVPPPSSLAALNSALEPLRRSGSGVTWVPEERQHVTLAFLGEVADPVPYGEALAEAVRDVAPFSLRLSGGGAFPRAARPRVLWAGVTGDVDALSTLARIARRRARALSIAVERAAYVPHVTVARVRRPDADVGDALAALDAVRGEPWTVTDVVLMRSVLGPQPEYRVLRRCPL